MPDQTPLNAGDLARILRVYLRIVDELPFDTEAGYLDASGHVHFLPDIGQKLRVSREAAEILSRLQRRDGG